MSDRDRIRTPPIPASDVIDLKRLSNILWRKKLLIVLITLVFALLSAYKALVLSEPKFSAQSVVLLETSPAQVLDLESVLPSLSKDSEAINTELEVLRSRELIGQVVKTLDLVDDPEFNAFLRPPDLRQKITAFLIGPDTIAQPSETLHWNATIDAVIEATKVQNQPATYVLRIAAETANPVKSQALANELAAQYVQYKVNVKLEATRAASEWLSTRAADLKIDLEEAEARLSQASRESELLGPDFLASQELRLKQLRDRLERTQDDAMLARQIHAKLEGLKGAAPEQIVQNTSDPQLAATFDGSGASALFDLRFRTLLTEAEQDQERLERQTAALSASVTDLERDLQAQNVQLREIEELRRNAEATRLLYEHFLNRLKETSAQEGVQSSDSRILSYAVAPLHPSSPNVVNTVAVGLVMGLLASLAIALITEMRYEIYVDPNVLHGETGLPVMGQIPLLPSSNRRDSIHFLAHKPMSAQAEAVRNLRTSVLLAPEGKTSQIIMLSSALPSEGKSTLSFALAQNLSEMGKKVLLVEGDIRRKVFSEYIEPKQQTGLAQVLAGKTSLAAAVHTDATINADILPCETFDQNAADVFSSRSFAEFLEQARTLYDHIIVDTPPVLVVPDARVIAQNVDILLLVVHWKKTQKSQVRDSIDMFQSVGVPVDGLVLNRINPDGMKSYGYGGAYGAYSNYGSKYYAG